MRSRPRRARRGNTSAGSLVRTVKETSKLSSGRVLLEVTFRNSARNRSSGAGLKWRYVPDSNRRDTGLQSAAIAALPPHQVNQGGALKKEETSKLSAQGILRITLGNRLERNPVTPEMYVTRLHCGYHESSYQIKFFHESLDSRNHSGYDFWFAPLQVSPSV